MSQSHLQAVLLKDIPGGGISSLLWESLSETGIVHYLFLSLPTYGKKGLQKLLRKPLSEECPSHQKTSCLTVKVFNNNL